MTDSLIDSAFTYLPEGVKHDEIELIKQKLKRRRLELEAVASQYYRYCNVRQWLPEPINPIIS